MLLEPNYQDATLSATIRAYQFDAGSYDNHSAADKLRFSFSEAPSDSLKLLGCPEQFGALPIVILVTDEAGNQSVCEIFYALRLDPIIPPDCSLYWCNLILSALNSAT